MNIAIHQWYLTRFYLKQYIERYIVRAIVLFLGKVLSRSARYHFLPAIYRFCFATYIVSTLRYIIFAERDIVPVYCHGIVKYMYTSPKRIYVNDKSSSLRSHLFEMASGDLNAFNVTWLSLDLRHYWTYLPWFHEKNPYYNAWNPIYNFRSKEDNCITVEE